MARAVPADLKNLKVANFDDPIEKMWDRTRRFIKDKECLGRFDFIMENFEFADDAEWFFFEMLSRYIDDEVSPEGYGFGVHATSKDLGFWQFNTKTNDLDMPYQGMKDRSDEDWEEDVDVEEDEPVANPDPPVEPEPEPEPEEVKPQESGEVNHGELLDSTGQVIGQVEYRRA